MTEHTEKNVLMKCTKCGYEEEVPRWLIDELFQMNLKKTI